MPDTPAAWRAPPRPAEPDGPSAQASLVDRRRAWLSGIGLACSLPPLWAAWQRWTVGQAPRIGDRTVPELTRADDGLATVGADAAAVDTMILPAAAWAPIRLTCELALDPPQRIPLPPTFNRALLLCQDWAEGPGGWVGGAVDLHETRTGYGLSYIWWTGIQRFAMIELPAPGYLRSLHDGQRDTGVPVAEFLKRRLGFRRDRLKADDPAPFAFHEAEFQAIPARLQLRVERAALAGLVVGDTVSVSLGRTGTARAAASADAARGGPGERTVDGSSASAIAAPGSGAGGGIRATVHDIAGLTDRADVMLGISLDDVGRRQFARLALEHELNSARPQAPRWITLSLTGSGASDGSGTPPGFVWVPRAAVLADAGSAGRSPPLGRVWAVLEDHAIPVRVLIGGHTDTHVAVQEALPAGLPLAVEPAVWADWPHEARARLLRLATTGTAMAGTAAAGTAAAGTAATSTAERAARAPVDTPLALALLRPGQPIIVDADPALRPGQAVRFRTREPG